MRYEYGQIILVPVADGRGNVEPHPAVILVLGFAPPRHLARIEQELGKLEAARGQG